MYDHFDGEVARASGTAVVLRVAGIGYELLVPIQTASALREGQRATLFAILHVTEGVPLLLGFAQRAERDLARRLMSVSGVGPKLALALLSTLDPQTLATHVRNQDVAALKRVRGVGAKTAERLCLELRDKLDDQELGDLPLAAASRAHAQAPAAEDAIAALVTLGYPEKEARQKVERAVAATPGAPTEALVKTVLRG
ncbi:MAG: Holliday junction branch migration protein RuvA [Planctomycetes bacterium]|nr:Holliday junction branch migration protein RuvA [Planctomycetota bacterium]